MGEVVKFFPADAAKDPDAVLEQAIGNYQNVLVLGWDKDGELDCRGDLGLTKENALWLAIFFTHKLMAGDFTE